MEVVRFSCLEDLEPHAVAWDRLAMDVPFRTWAWLATWWRHYSPLGQLCVLGVFDGAELIGIAPWYRTQTRLHGQTLRLLGDGEVCSEYGTILHQAGKEHAVAIALTEWLLSAGGEDQWDVVEMASTDWDDPMPAALARLMKERGCQLHSRTGRGCWRAPFPATWEEYLRTLSKERRKKIRRMQRRYVDSGEAVLHTVQDKDQLETAQEILIDLHQRRRNMLGEPGCFASPRYCGFQQDVLPKLLADSRLGLHWVEFEGRPIAAEYHLLGDRIAYCYQGGISPQDMAISPGQIATLLTFKQAIEQGYEAFDLLRGNEPYKRQWRAQFHPSLELRIVACRTAARLRHGIWQAGQDAKQWLKETLETLSMR